MSLTSVRAGQATVEINADDSKLVKSLNSAKSKMQSWVPSIGAIAKAAGASAAAAGVGLAALVKHTADVAGEIDDLAQRTGISAKSISTLKYAANMAGTDLSGLQGAMRNIAKELDAGGKSFEKYGINVEQFRQLSPEDQFKAVADAVSRVTDPTARAAAAMDMLGKSGQDLIPLISGGSREITRMQREAERLGLALSNEAAADGAKFGDSIDTVTAQVDALGRKIGAGLIPYLQPLADEFVESTAAALRWADESKKSLDDLALAFARRVHLMADEIRFLSWFMIDGGLKDAIAGVGALFEVGLYNSIATFIDDFQVLWDTEFVQYIVTATRDAMADVIEAVGRSKKTGNPLLDAGMMAITRTGTDAIRNTDTSAKSAASIARRASLDAAVDAKNAFADMMIKAADAGVKVVEAKADTEIGDVANRNRDVVGQRKNEIATKPAGQVETDQAKMTLASVGTFNARAAGGLAGNSDTAAIRVATQQTARNTARLAAAGGAAAVVFGA